MANTAIRGVCPEYGEMRNEVPAEGRWISASEEVEKRRVCFLGGSVKQQLFSGRNAVGETVLITGVRFTVVGVMDRKLQMSNYFTSDDVRIRFRSTAAPRRLEHAISAGAHLRAGRAQFGEESQRPGAARRWPRGSNSRHGQKGDPDVRT